jgi:adenylate kinase family enzyme
MLTLDQLSRVAIVGTSCSGKTTLAGSLANALHAPHVELDALHWGPDWTPCPTEQLRAAVDQATAEPRWVCDGNYSMVRDLVWSRATSIVWLNYSFSLVFKRALRRTLSRCFHQTPIYAGNRESFSKSFLSRDSILLWVFNSHWRLKREYSHVLAGSQFKETNLIKLNSASAADQWLAAVQRLALE